MDITKKSVGMLVDELSTTVIKTFMAQEVVCNSTDDKEVAVAAKKAQSLNARRNQLITAIDEALGSDAFSPSGKTYD